MPVEKLEKPGSKEEISEEHIDKMIGYSRDTARPLELSYWEHQKAELKKKQESRQNSELEKINKMIRYAKDTARPLELAYWESQKTAIQNKYFESDDLSLEHINKMIDYARNTGRPLELSFWEIRRKTLGQEQVTPEQEVREQDQEASYQNIPERPVAHEKEPVQGPEIQLIPPEKPVEKELPQEKTVETEEPEEYKVGEVGPKDSDMVVREKTVSLSDRETIDQILATENGPVEIPGSLTLEKVKEEDVAVIESAINETVTPLESKARVSEKGTFFSRLRKLVKNKAVIYVGAGLMAFMAMKTEAIQNVTGMPSGVVKVLDKIPDARVPFEFLGMAAQEGARYRVMPYLTARYIGTEDFFDLEAIKAANAIGLEGKAADMFESSLAEYIDNFPETRKNNRFTTLDKHTLRNYMDVFVQIYNQEQSDSGVDTYQKFSDFLKSNFGAAWAYELALKVNSDKKIDPELSKTAKQDLLKFESVLKQAVGKSNIFFNQEEGVFNVVHSGTLIETYASRAGFMNVPKDSSKTFKSFGYGRTPDGTFSIASIEYGYSTLRWRDSFLPYGAEIRTHRSGEIEYKYNDSNWYFATGPEATYFDQGKKVQPNKSESGRKYLQERSRGGSALTRLDFITAQGLMTHWGKNPFGPLSYKLGGRAELIHSNPMDSDNILHPSHGCIRLDKEDAQKLKDYVGAGTSKIRITSNAGESWNKG